MAENDEGGSVRESIKRELQLGSEVSYASLNALPEGCANHILMDLAPVDTGHGYRIEGAGGNYDC